ncbi:sigma-70 family RNA polymerase sigma factor [Reyranella sp.]|uniref:sigma-70 family RNA polymerase sigma factor n=1 Tax=Reyranella sp. TaxID=1929291 RepID=UPI003F700852
MPAESPTDPSALEAEISAAIVRCAVGDKSALRLIYDLEAARMVGVAIRILRRRDLAEEATHDAFMRIWRSARSYDPSRGSARAWLYTIVRNQALTILRDERRFGPEEPADNELPQPDQALQRLPESSALRQCLQQLDTGRRNAIVLAYVHGFSHGELAGRLGMPLGTIKSWIRRGLASLQECMG